MLPLINTYRINGNHPDDKLINSDFIRVFIGLLMMFWSVSATASPTSIALNGITQQSSDKQDSLNSVIDPSVLIDDINKKLAATNSKLALTPTQADDASATGLLDDGSVFASRLYLKQLAFMYKGQLSRLANLQVLQKNRIELETQVTNWTGFSDPSPHPFLRADELKESVTQLSVKKDELESWMTVLDQALEQIVNTTKESTVKLRQADEAIEQAKESPEQQTRLSRERETLALQNEINFARAMSSQIEKQTVSEELLRTQARLQLARKQLSVASEHVELTQQDIDQVNKNIDSEIAQITAELNQVLSAWDAENKAVEQQTLTPSVTDKTVPAQLSDDAKQRELIGQTQHNSTEVKLQVLSRLLVYHQWQRDIWALRLALVKVTDREKANVIYDTITKNQAVLNVVNHYIRALRDQLLTQVTNQSIKQIDSTDVESNAAGAELKNLYLEQIVSYSRLLGTVNATQNLQDRCKQELDDKFEVKSFSGYLKEGLLVIRDFAAQIWTFELFAVQDSIEVNGQKISDKRSITVDKVVTALAILIVGYWIAIRLSRLVEALVVTHFNMDASLARIARRWILFAQVIVLIMISMLVVRIPLTIFAFMGGAVAIGAGFGMQNLLKNLISGLMLLFERPFRPGDLIEVGGIRGRVIDIGVRSSIICDANGIETLIPNSTFIEQNVTNWTLGNQAVRIVIKIGVAYGSSAGEVADMLLEVAGRHGLVEKYPPPNVQFDDFGNDALIFGLYVWVELKPDVSWAVVASDLRYMINKTLSEHGIVFAFPQRDIHLDTSRPLEVRVLKDALDKQDKL